MLGFSLQKLFVLAAIIAAVWYGFKFISRLDASRKAEAKLRRKDGAGNKASQRQAARKDVPEAEDMVQCPACRAYVPAQNASNCGRADCPY